MPKFTMGPWKCEYTSYYSHDYRLFKPNGEPLPLHITANDHSEQRATAQLIEAAPDLYEMLDRLLGAYIKLAADFASDYGFTREQVLAGMEKDDLVVDARKALDKVVGR